MINPEINSAKKILILGSEGFLGNAFVNHFIRSGHQVFGADIYAGSKKLPNDYYINVSSGLHNLNEVFKINQIWLCLNCAGAANVTASVTDPWHDYQLNTSLVANLLSIMNQNWPHCRFINISSAAVYGNPSVLPIGSDAPLRPISPYGIHKAASELLLHDYSRVLDIPAVSLRIFSSYGPGQKKLLLWDLFQKITKAEKGQEIVLFGTGDESRDYIYVDDIIQQVMLVIKHAEFRGEAYNIANGKEIFVRDIVNMMQKSLETHIPIKFSGDIRNGDPLNWKADIAPMVDWGYKESMPIDKGILNYVKWAIENA